MSKDQRILFPEQAARAEPNQLGGKASGLAWLTAAGAPVPPWCVITTDVFEEHVTSAKNTTDIDGLLMQLEKIEEDSIKAGLVEGLANQIREAILQQPMADPVQSGIVAAMQNIGNNQDFFAVRSSMVGEDSSHFSFAGQLQSFLFQQSPDEVLESVRQCWASAFSERALIYRKRAGLPMTGIQMGVILQLMVDARVSGVLFTAHPITGRRDQMLITAAWGLGEGIVNGLCNTDEFVWQHDGRELLATLADKDVMLVAAPGGGTEQKPVEQSRRRERCLQQEQVNELGNLSLRLVDTFGSPLDIEWTWNDAGLHILQARPITTLPAEDRDTHGPPRLVFDNSNIQESYCGVTTPLTFSFASNTYANVYTQLMQVLCLPRETIRNNQPLVRNLLVLVGGRIFYNLNNWYLGLCLLPSFGRNKQDMEAMMGVEQPLDFVEDESLGLLEKIRRLPPLIHAATRLKLKFLSLDREVPEFLSRFELMSKRVGRAQLASASLDELMQRLEFVRAELLGHWHTPIINDFYVMNSVGRLRQLVKKARVDEATTMVNDLLTGEGDIASTEPTYALMHIAQLIAVNPSLKELFSRAGPAQALAMLAEREPRIHSAVEEYISRFGDRTMGELKLETISLREDPSFLVKVIQSYLKMPDLDPQKLRGNEQSRRLKSEVMLLGSLKPWQRIRVPVILKRARTSIKNRESMRLARTVMFGLFRDVYKAIGSRLHEAGKLNAARDIFYLAEEEIAAYYEGRSVTTGLAELAELRKIEFSGYELREMPNRFEVSGPVYFQDYFLASDQVVANRDATVLQGTGCYAGIVRGPLRIILKPDCDLDMCGRILTTLRTDPGWAPLFPTALGILVERGSTLSHSAVVARELGIPAVVGVPGLLSIVEDGEMVTLNGGTGEVHRTRGGMDGSG